MIDGLSYCKTNGQFKTHLSLHLFSEQSYFEKYIGLAPKCLCGNSRKMSTPDWTFLPTCGAKCKNEYLRILKTEIWSDEKKKEVNDKVSIGLSKITSIEFNKRRTDALIASLTINGEAIKQKRRLTSLLKYGDPTYSNSKTASKTRINFDRVLKDKINEKRSITNLERYGKFHILGNTTSKFERDIIDKINGYSLRSYLHKQGQLYVGNASFYYLYDLADESKKKIIEFNGDYWHANPKIYKDDVVLGKGITKRTAKEIRESDAKKIKAANDRGYQVLVIWESDFYKNPKKEIDKCLNWLTE